ncbi:MAG: PEP-CTERM sorting domain-containing protein [Sedimentisphaeraceae bacterium JB056]
MKLCVYISLFFFAALSPAGWVNTIGNYSNWNSSNRESIAAQNEDVISGIKDSCVDSMDQRQNVDIGGGIDDSKVSGFAKVPEPMTFAILGLGALFVGGFRRRR